MNDELQLGEILPNASKCLMYLTISSFINPLLYFMSLNVIPSGPGAISNPHPQHYVKYVCVVGSRTYQRCYENNTSLCTRK